MRNIRDWLPRRPVLRAFSCTLAQWRRAKQMAMVASLIALFATFALIPERAPGQIIKISFEKPRVSVPIRHPATTGVTLQGKKVAFGQISGPCAQQFSDLMTPIFQANQVEVVNREQLNGLLAEHKFQLSSSVDPTTAVALGKVLGPSVMIFVAVSRCSVERNLLYEDAALGRSRMNVARTQAHFLASVHTVDLATGRELAVQSVETNPRRENRSATGVPEYPGEVEVQDMAVHEAATKAEHLYFPWTEMRTVSFMNSKECGLRQAYDLLRAGDTKGALTQSQENVEACKADLKVNHRADAYYNLGVAYMVNDAYDQALTALGESNSLHSDKAVLDAIAECRLAKAGAEAVAQNESKASKETEHDRHQQQVRADQQTKETLTNDTVVEMVRNGFSAELLIRAIAVQPTKFSVTPSDMMALKRAGVPDSVIAAMLDKK